MHFGTTTAQLVTQVCPALRTSWFNVDPSSFVLAVQHRKLGAVTSRRQLSPLPPLLTPLNLLLPSPPSHSTHHLPSLLYTTVQRVTTNSKLTGRSCIPLLLLRRKSLKTSATENSTRRGFRRCKRSKSRVNSCIYAVFVMIHVFHIQD